MWNYQRMMRSKEREKTVLSYKMANAGLQQDKEEIKRQRPAAQPAYKPLGPGLQFFGLITLPLEIVNYALLG